VTRSVKPQVIKPQSPVEIGNPPSWLGKEGKREWRRIAPILNERMTITTGDLGILESYCTAIGTMREAQRLLNRDGLLLNSKKHPAIGTLNAAQTTARLAANELGLTPVSRSRPAIRDTGDDDDGDNPLAV
jgi:P27 family predicted phage terminase small subunit